MEDQKKGKFIVFEGIDGSGKSTQIQLLTDRLRKMGIPCYTTMEPTDSPIGSIIRQIMTGRMQADARVIAALFAADRLDHLLNDINGISHIIEEGTTVLMDRYYFSSYAYQSIDVPMEWVIQANVQSSAILRPDVNLFLDIEPDAALERITRSRLRKELFEEKTRLAGVRQKYIEAFERLRDSECVAVIDGSGDTQAVAQDVWNVVKEMIG